MTKNDCIFCMLANGAIPTNMIYEDNDFAVILDAAPAAKGHALVIPKQHADNLYELPDDIASKVLPVAKKIAVAMKETFHCDGVNVLQNNELAAGQTVYHFHTHIIPRFTGDKLGLAWKQGKPTDEEQAETCRLLKAAL
jgi:histidine triad (HIT) family protein